MTAMFDVPEKPPETPSDLGDMTGLSADQSCSEPTTTTGADRRAQAERERRRENDRRRSSRGLLELRARRDGVADDRRARERRAQLRQRLLAFFARPWQSRRTKSSTQ